ncbi:hypothetical protein PIB30_022755 [Stylosanthes scabra]|uniref:UDP-glycosyltransferase 89A2 n=1 Tax=Stylosanthes scabra TaxID=79078 RepID=A0ABU6R9J7_9FABA|nr:hypothetical protein [Stylosanthes scabra]
MLNLASTMFVHQQQTLISLRSKHDGAMSKPHIVVFPYPAQGHMLPLLDLTQKLALHGLTITIIITPKNLSTLKPLLTAHPTTIRTLTLPFPSHPNLPAGAENIREVGNTGNYHFINALSKLQTPIIHWFCSQTNPPSALISDFFLGWTQQLADKIGIKRIAFFSSGAFLTAVSNHCWRSLLPLPSDNAEFEFPSIPGTPSFPREHLPSIFLRYNESNPDAHIVKEGFEANPVSCAYVFNSFQALEGPYLDHLRADLKPLRVFAVSPLGFNRAGQSLNGKEHETLLGWLDKWEEGSVLYVCFGSQKVLTKEQMEALALGLERSMVPFVWVVKEGCGPVPDGFAERVLGRGLVVRSWAPQVAILGHRAVGGFLSHCGWNSVLEAVAAGVMILGWPMEADQFVNARLLVEDMGVGVKVCEGAGSTPDPEELGRVIAGTMGSENPQRRKAKRLSEEAAEAVGNGGHSSKMLDELVELLMLLSVKKEQ